MKGFRYIYIYASVALTALAVSCSTSTDTTVKRRFNEGASVNLVLKFYSWSGIYMTRPDSREGAFMPLLDRDGVAREVARRPMPRNLAVVIIGYAYGPDQVMGLSRECKKFLGEQGFRRVVVLRSGYNKDDIDGLPVIDDSAITGLNDIQQKAPPVFAIVPPTVGADVANPSIAGIR